MLLIPMASREKNSSAVTHLIGEMMFEFAVRGSRATNRLGTVGALDVAGVAGSLTAPPPWGSLGSFCFPDPIAGAVLRCRQKHPQKVGVTGDNCVNTHTVQRFSELQFLIAVKKPGFAVNPEGT